MTTILGYSEAEYMNFFYTISKNAEGFLLLDRFQLSMNDKFCLTNKIKGEIEENRF